ncbi:hypothetical protein SteCoe_23200 [Stentor coeruleus]|uniref:Uncharacterized protein n=1 Tax=Stentor coeruleus TaxID=5963 RepID=A0A1R2BKJ1_9CILI|nr:hypothetical protein SteCoe_23200 [Stentor coeruleus]
MEEVDDPRLQQKIAEIRETLQKLGTSYTEDETSEFGKSAISSEDSLEKFYNFLSPHTDSQIEKPAFSFESPIPKRELYMPRIKNLKENHQEKLNFEDKKGRDKSQDLETTKTEKAELNKKINFLHELLQKKDKELSKVVYEKESHAKAEESLKKKIEDYKKREEILIEELNHLRKSKSIFEDEKKDMIKALSDSRDIIEKLKKALKSKEQALAEMRELQTEEDDKGIEKIKSKSFEPKKIDFQRLRIPEKFETLASPEKYEQNFTDRSIENKYKKLCYESMRIIGVTSTKDIFPRLLHLRQYHTKNKKSKKLVSCISNMIIQCCPDGTFKNPPTTREIWRWITRLLEEYMKLKQTTSGETFYKLLEILQIESVDEIIDKVTVLVMNKGGHKL